MRRDPINDDPDESMPRRDVMRWWMERDLDAERERESASLPTTRKAEDFKRT